MTINNLSFAIPDNSKDLHKRAHNFKDQTVQKELRHYADSLLIQYDHSLIELKKLELELHNNPKTPLFIHAGVKLAISKALFSLINKPIQVGIVVSVFRESHRLRPREINGLIFSTSSTESALDPHPHGENFVIEKDRQLRWLTKINPNITCRLIWVDDGCDTDTGKSIQNIIDHRKLHETHEVLFLEELIQNTSNQSVDLLKEAVVELKSTKDSKKGGSVYAGMASSIISGDDIVVYTDADLSYNLGLLGTLIQPIVGGASAVTGNRRHELSVSEDAEFLHSEGKKRTKILLGTIRNELLGHYLPTDTQAGFKAFDTTNLATVVAMPDKVTDMSFDIQLLARHAAASGVVATSVPIVVLDSSELTTADNSDTYSSMAKTVLVTARESQTLTAETEKILQILTNHWTEVVKLLEEPTEDTDISNLQEILTTTVNTTASKIKYSEIRIGVLKLIEIFS